MTLKILGISGKIGSGKSTTALAVEKLMPNKAVLQINFGDALKSMLAAVFDFPIDLCYSQEGKLTQIVSAEPVSVDTLWQRLCRCTGRECSLAFVAKVYQFDSADPVVLLQPCSVGVLLQRFGNAVREEFGENFWIDQLDKHVTNWCALSPENAAGLVIVGDVRFVNEADFILRDRKGCLVRLNGDPAGVAAASDRSKTHSSETALDDYRLFHAILNTELLSRDAVAKAVCALCEN